jgi:hypothetical protein
MEGTLLKNDDDDNDHIREKQNIISMEQMGCHINFKN